MSDTHEIFDYTFTSKEKSIFDKDDFLYIALYNLAVNPNKPVIIRRSMHVLKTAGFGKYFNLIPISSDQIMITSDDDVIILN